MQRRQQRGHKADGENTKNRDEIRLVRSKATKASCASNGVLCRQQCPKLTTYTELSVSTRFPLPPGTGRIRSGRREVRRNIKRIPLGEGERGSCMTRVRPVCSESRHVCVSSPTYGIYNNACSPSSPSFSSYLLGPEQHLSRHHHHQYYCYYYYYCDASPHTSPKVRV